MKRYRTKQEIQEDISSQSRECGMCEERLDFSEFNKRAASQDGITPNCRNCESERSRTNRAEYPERYKRTKDRMVCKQYGITTEIYDSILESQKGKCSICFSSDPGRGKSRFSIDHDHDTGKIRGLLCSNCNRGIGLLKDDPIVVKRAYTYLRDSQ